MPHTNEDLLRVIAASYFWLLLPFQVASTTSRKRGKININLKSAMKKEDLMQLKQ